MNLNIKLTGAMNSAVPILVVMVDPKELVVNLDNPKSVTFASKFESSKMLALFKSLWQIERGFKL